MWALEHFTQCMSRMWKSTSCIARAIRFPRLLRRRSIAHWRKSDEWLLSALQRCGRWSLRPCKMLSVQVGTAAVSPGSGEADIFIHPGFEFRVVSALLTNFHLPKSTLLMLVAAFAGRENVLNAYTHAVEERYRFFSYGDCMFVE